MSLSSCGVIWKIGVKSSRSTTAMAQAPSLRVNWKMPSARWASMWIDRFYACWWIALVTTLRARPPLRINSTLTTLSAVHSKWSAALKFGIIRKTQNLLFPMLSPCLLATYSTGQTDPASPPSHSMRLDCMFFFWHNNTLSFSLCATFSTRNWLESPGNWITFFLPSKNSGFAKYLYFANLTLNNLNLYCCMPQHRTLGDQTLLPLLASHTLCIIFYWIHFKNKLFALKKTHHLFTKA